MIHLLDIHIANLIAAGEVVDKPSSALKEVVENAIDANATVITVEIKGGGISYMRVTDNGGGMNAEDLGRAVLRHATSKIKDENDLARIKTLGFRGEALAAISSVSDLKIFTKTKESQNGYMLESSSGQNTKISEAGCANGTTVIIERLFSKIPARQKFLKRDITEGMYCKWIIEKIALSNPFVSFKFIQDGKQKIFTPGNGNYKDTVYSIFGGEIADYLLQVGDFNDEIDETGGNIKVCGFISKIENGQKTRVNENFFVNGRYVYSKTIMSAVEEAYKSIAETSRFPFCALYIKIDESKVDINVHPQKMEIKFSDERKIYASVYYAIKNTLNNYGEVNNDFIFTKSERENSAPIINLYKEENNTNDNNDNNENYTSKYFDLSQKPREQTPVIDFVADIPFQKGTIAERDAIAERNSVLAPFVKKIEPEPINENTKIVNNNYNKYDYKIIGEAFYGYIFVEKNEKIIIIDKHAAHERIIYDIMLKKAADENINSGFKSQILLIPVEVKLTPEETAGILEIEKDMKKMGILFEWKDSETVSITEVPAEIFDADIGETIKEAAYLRSAGDLSAHETMFEKLVMLSAKKSAACKAAMKTGIVDSAENIAWLADRVMNYEDVKYCPHGRPVAFEITKKDIEKQFKR